MMDGKHFNVDYFWKLFLKGDDKSFNMIYQHYVDNLLLYGSKLCPEKEMVEDCVQDIFIELFLKRNTISFGIENLKGYLFISLRNNLIKKINKNKKQKLSENNDFLFQTDYSFEDKLINSEISEEIKKGLRERINNLPPKQKEIVYLKFEEELEYTEISKILNISVESARKLLYRSLLSLRKVLKKNEFYFFLLIFSKKR